MAIVVREVSDDELPRVAEIETAAYADNPLSPVLFPGPFPSDSGEKRLAALKEQRHSDPTARYIQAHDEETGLLVAFAKWHIFDTPEAAAAAQRPTRSFGPGTNREACEEFFGTLSSRKKELMGDNPHLCTHCQNQRHRIMLSRTDLHMLHTDPKFQGRGAGGMLIEWGTKIADELGIPAYLEASPKGYRLYQRHGFKDLEVFDLDLAKYGGTGVYKEPIMLREPAGPKAPATVSSS